MSAACPMCGKSAQPETRPFCSRACKNEDLLNWIDGRYAIPAVESDELDDDGYET